ncbi:MAG TPA: integrase, partial [Mycobacterium sp.]|nr:integrase [Mycobacterium sp.]
MAGRAHRRGWGHLRKLPSTKWQATYLHRDTRHRAPSTFTMKTDGEAWLSAERRLIERDEWTPPSERETAARTAQTVLQYATAWIRERPLKETTREHYRVMLAEHVAPTLGPITLKNLSAPMVREWYSRTLTNRPTYRAHAYGLLHAICATAVEDELLEANPCRIKRATTTRPKRESVILSPTQVAELADRMDES